MPRQQPDASLRSFARFGELLKFLRRRARLTQRQLAIEVGYSEVHISRFEGSQRPPDEQTLLALFVPALDLADEPELVAELLQLARQARGEAAPPAPTAAISHAAPPPILDPLEPIPLLPSYAVARKPVLAWLREQLSTERALAVCGMPGLGKTTLVSALALERAVSVPVFWLTLTPGVTATVDVVLRQLALFLALHGQAQVAPLLQARDAATGGPTLDQQVALVGAALGRLTWDQLAKRDAAYGGLPLLCFDNLPPDDPALTQVLGHLLAATPVAMLLTSRADVAVPGVVSIRPPALDEVESRELIARLGVTLDPDVVERLLRKTGGSPMLLRLALGQLRNERADPLRFVEQLDHQPQIAAYLVDTMLRGLGDGVRRLVALVAVLRQPVSLYDETLLELIRAMDEPYDIAAAIAEARRRQLLDQPGYARLHPLVREQILVQLALDGTRKRVLHRIAGEWSEGAGNAVEAAYHWACVDDVERAVERLTDQAAAIVTGGQAHAAVDVLTTVLARVRRREGDAGGLVRHVLTLRGDLLRETPHAAEAEADYRLALALATQPMLKAQLGARLARCLLRRGQADEALALCRSARASRLPEHTLLGAELRAVESAAYLQRRDFAAAHTAAAAALAALDQLGRERHQATAELRVEALLALAAALGGAGDDSAAAVELERAVQVAEAAGLSRAAHQADVALVAALLRQGALEQALARGRAAVPRLGAAVDHAALARMTRLVGETYLALDEPAAALAYAEQTVAAAEVAGDQPLLATSQLALVWVLLALGRRDPARALAERVLLTADAALLHPEVVAALRARAIVALLDGRPEQAVALLRRAVSLAPGVGVADAAPDIALALRLARALAGDPGGLTVDAAAESQAPPAVHLERTLLRCATLLAEGADDAAAQLEALAVPDRYRRLHAIAARLQAAALAQAPATALPALLWGPG